MDGPACALAVTLCRWEPVYATRLRRAGYAGKIVSFEPGTTAFCHLAAHSQPDTAWHCHQLALGDHDGLATLNIAADTEGSSLLRVEAREVRNSPGSAYVGAERVRVARLQTVWPELSLDGGPFYLKLDTQGTELAILRGADEVLRHVELIEVELSLVPLYRGGPVFDEVASYLRERGFRLISLEGVDEERDTGHMLQVDAIFLRA